MATTWDWGPVAQGLNGLMMHYAQQRQYQNLLKTLGTGMGGAGPFGGPSSAPPMPTTTARREDDNGMPIPGAPTPIMPAQGMTTSILPAGNGRAGEWDWMTPDRGPLGLGILPAIRNLLNPQDGARPAGAGQGINPTPTPTGFGGGMMSPQMAALFRQLPPQIGMPLLLQTLQQRMGGTQPHKLEQFDPEKDVVDPYTGQVVRKGAPKQTTEAKVADLTPEEVAAVGLPKGTVAQRKADGTINVVSTPKDTPGRKYEVINGVPGWVTEQGFVPDPQGPKKPAGEGDGNKPPQGYRWTANGNLEPIKGGPADPTRPGIGVGRRTEDQAKNTQLYTRAKEQLPIVLDNFDALGGVVTGGAESIPFLGSTLAPIIGGERYQRADGALKDIAASYLYSVSGATATPSEIEGTVERVRPRATDSAATRADKRKRIQDMVESIKYRAGGESSNAAQPSVAPDGVDPQVWQFMTPQERALWQN